MLTTLQLDKYNIARNNTISGELCYYSVSSQTYTRDELAAAIEKEGYTIISKKLYAGVVNIVSFYTDDCMYGKVI